MRSIWSFIIISIVWSGCAEEYGRFGRAQLDRNFLWHLFGKNGINIEPAWAITKGNPELTIAVLDSNFLASNAFSNCPGQYQYFDFVHGAHGGREHGTSVASVLSTCPGNRLGLVGVNNASQIIWLESGRNLDPVEYLFAWAIKASNCVDKRVINCPAPIRKPVDVLNASYLKRSVVSTDEEVREDYLKLSDIAKTQGTIIVAAAGNLPINADNTFPHSLSGVISVGATTRSGISADFSSWGETVDIMAPGKDIPVAAKNGVALKSGSSFASPIIAGVVSLMKSVYSELNWKTAIYFLQSTAVPMDCDAYCVGRPECEKDCCKNGIQICTPGRVDAGAAVLAAQNAAHAGLPKVALVDADNFFIKLRLRADGGTLGKFIVRNVGGAAGSYTLISENPLVTISPERIRLERKGASNDSQEITLSSRRSFPGWTNIKIRSPESERGIATYSDEIVVSANRVN